MNILESLNEITNIKTIRLISKLSNDDIKKLRDIIIRMFQELDIVNYKTFKITREQYEYILSKAGIESYNKNDYIKFNNKFSKVWKKIFDELEVRKINDHYQNYPYKLQIGDMMLIKNNTGCEVVQIINTYASYTDAYYEYIVNPIQYKILEIKQIDNNISEYRAEYIYQYVEPENINKYRSKVINAQDEYKIVSENKDIKELCSIVETYKIENTDIINISHYMNNYIKMNKY